MKTLRTLVIAMFLLVRSEQVPARQLIQTGWDSPTASEFRKGCKEFEKYRLFDGTTIVPTRLLTDGSTEVATRVFSTNHWEAAEFARMIIDIQNAGAHTCTNNFLMLGANPGNVDWFSDSGWREIVGHWRLLARAAREAKMTGILFDPEPYERPWSQFHYAAQTNRNVYTFEEMSAKARERGRDVMKAVAEEFPNMTLFAYRIFSDLPRSGNPEANDVRLRNNIYGLLPSFVDGWCDSLPAAIHIVDGDEAAYYFQSEEIYFASFAHLKTSASGFVSHENREKIRSQLLVSHGIYLDAYVPGLLGKKYFDLGGETPASRLFRYVSSAVEASDGFVWVYGEQGRWWPKENSRPIWPDRFPGIVSALSAAKYPTLYATEFLAESKTLKNDLRDPSFETTGLLRLTSPWSVWQSKDSNGKAVFSNASIHLSGMANGSVGQTIPVHYGEVYAISLKVKEGTAGEVGSAVRWQDGNGKWIDAGTRLDFKPIGQPDRDGWRNIVGLVRVPSGAGKLYFLILAQGQTTASDASFKNPIVAKVSF